MHMLINTDQAYCCHARPPKDEHRRLYQSLPFPFRPSFPEEEIQRDDKRQYTGKVRLRGASASCEGGVHSTGATGRRVAKGYIGQCMQSVS
jgi:hypothetical protein